MYACIKYDNMNRQDVHPKGRPALVDEFAAPLPSDDTPELKAARSVLKQTQLEYQPLGLAYDANVHGWRQGTYPRGLMRSTPLHPPTFFVYM